MKTPISDFLDTYSECGSIRLHMPGHKGKGSVEARDITEIFGADSLYEANGIIAESRRNAGSIFGCETFYSTEGSSLAIRAMLYLAELYARERGQKPCILAGRNAHKVFLSTAALLNIDIKWICPAGNESYLSCRIDTERLDNELAENEITAVYITSPDYLGNLADVKGIARVCQRHGVPLLVDNAHGAYLKFLRPSLHPMDLGAAMCCDSAHKTLPVLTGGAYLHVSDSADPLFKAGAQNALALFGSTSPSYLILDSLDRANAALEGRYASDLAAILPHIDELKAALQKGGYKLYGNEPLKLTVAAKAYGYSGLELAKILAEQNIMYEFCDNDFIVFMFSPANTAREVSVLKKALLAIKPRSAITDPPPHFSPARQAMNAAEAILAPAEDIPVEEAIGRVLAAPGVSCPPAVPIVAIGEVIDAHAVQCFKYYGINTCRVVKQQNKKHPS